MSTVRDAFRAFYGKYRENHTPTPRQRKVAESIMACRTAAMGGHAHGRDACGHIEVSHNSCRDRHCPNCQATSGAAWAESRMRDVLNAPYFHVVLTLPSALRMLVFRNQKRLYEDRTPCLDGLCGAEANGRFYGIVDACFKKDWHVHIRRPFSGPAAAVVKYLAGYTHRVAVSNGRIVSVGDGRVVFKPKHKDKNGERKPIALGGEEFVLGLTDNHLNESGGIYYVKQ